MTWTCPRETLPSPLILLTSDQPWPRPLAGRLASHAEMALIVVDQHLSGAARTARAAALPAQSWIVAPKLLDRRRVRSLKARDR